MADIATFQKASGKDDYKEIFDHNIDVFSNSPDFNWTFDDIKREVKEGWQLYSVIFGDDIIAAVFYMIDGKSLLTKNTALKMNFQGLGISHQIKEFFEEVAKENSLEKIFHYCGIDNFRMYSLNESHGYSKTDKKFGNNGQVVEWVKEL